MAAEPELIETDQPAVDKTTRNGVVLLGLAAVFNLVGNVAFHVLAARSTNVGLYGLIATLLSLGFLAGAIGSGLQYAVARHAAVPGRDPWGVLGRSVWSCLPVLVAVGVLAALSGSIARYLHASSIAAVNATLFYFAVTIIAALPVGILMAQRRFAVLAISTAIGVAFRLGLALVVGLHKDPAVVALMTSAYATLLGGAINAGVVFFTRPSRRPEGYRHEPRGAVRSEGARLAVLGACLWSTWLLPISFARHYLPPLAAGHFSVGHLAGSALLYLAAPITTAYFPAIMRSRNPQALRGGLLATACLGVVGAVSMSLVGPVAFRHLFGDAFPPGHLLFLELGLSAGMCSVASYIVWTSRAKDQIPPGIPVGCFTALAVELLIGASGYHGENYLAISPMVSLSIGAMAAVAFQTLRPAATTETVQAGRQPAQAPLSKSLVAMQADIPSEAPSLLPYLSVGVMACDEELTIHQCLEALLGERENGFGVGKVVVVASGSTDSTRDIVRSFARSDSRVVLVEEPSRTGKVNAINLFLERCDLPLAGLVNADVVLAPGALSLLTRSFRRPSVGMVGGRPLPQNERKGLCNSLVHLEWELHDAVARRNPKLGEAVLFRRIFERLYLLGTADEVAIEALLLDAGYELRYEPRALVLNNGPTTLGDYVRHRRRIHGGHIIQQKWDGYTPSTMRSGVVVVGILDAVRRDPSIARTLPLAVAAEIYIRATTVLTSCMRRKTPALNWDPIKSAKRAIPQMAIEADTAGSLGEQLPIHGVRPEPALQANSAELLASSFIDGWVALDPPAISDAVADITQLSAGRMSSQA